MSVDLLFGCLLLRAMWFVCWFDLRCGDSGFDCLLVFGCVDYGCFGCLIVVGWDGFGLFWVYCLVLRVLGFMLF